MTTSPSQTVDPLSVPTAPATPTARASVWGMATWLDPARRSEVVDLAQELESLGYHRLWVGGGQEPGLHEAFGALLDATSTLGVASGILNLWIATPAETADAVRELERRHPGRFLLGVGTSHAPLVERTGQDYTKPYSAMVDWLDGADATGEPAIGEGRRVLAALGPRMVHLARDRSIGAHPYFVPPEHTAEVRSALGHGPLLAPEVAVVLETDPERAREIARAYMSRYLAFPNYTSNLLRIGWAATDLEDGGSDRLVDELIPWGDVDAVAVGLARHIDAGADELAVQVLTAEPDRLPADELRRLAPALVAR